MLLFKFMRWLVIMPKDLTLGIVPAPGITATLSEKVKDDLLDTFESIEDYHTNWKIEIIVDQITGAAENASEIMDQAIHIKSHNNWDYVISLTDLPIFNLKYIVLADVNKEQKAAQVSLPAYGALPKVSNVKNTFIQILQELQSEEKDDIGIAKHHKSVSFLSSIKRAFTFTSIKRVETDQNASILYLIQPKWNGTLKLIAGMTVANSPWSIMPSFKKVIGLAFATGSYMLIFNTLWQLSAVYEFSRFLIVMLTAMTAMVTWNIFAHNLWEKKQNYQSQRLRLMYNATTITTLGVSVLMFYIAMFILFAIAVMIFVPAETFESVLHHDIDIVDYAKLAWLVTSAATVAGAIGAGLENEESVRRITYGYRQYVRSKEIQRLEEEKTKEEKGKNPTDAYDYDP